jgi:hypothetical protein
MCFDFDRPDRKQGFKAAFFSFFMFAGGIYEYQDLARWEVSGGLKRMNSLLIMAYDVAGKSGVLLLSWAMGALFLYAAKRHLCPELTSASGPVHRMEVADEGE